MPRKGEITKPRIVEAVLSLGRCIPVIRLERIENIYPVFQGKSVCLKSSRNPIKKAKITRMRLGNWQVKSDDIKAEANKKNAEVDNKKANGASINTGVNDRKANGGSSNTGVNNKKANGDRNNTGVHEDDSNDGVLFEYEDNTGVYRKKASEGRSNTGVNNKKANDDRSNTGVNEDDSDDDVLFEYEDNTGVNSKKASGSSNNTEVDNKKANGDSRNAGVNEDDSDDDVLFEYEDNTGANSKKASEGSSNTGVDNKKENGDSRNTGVNENDSNDDALFEEDNTGVNNKKANGGSRNIGVDNKKANGDSSNTGVNEDDSDDDGGSSNTGVDNNKANGDISNTGINEDDNDDDDDVLFEYEIDFEGLSKDMKIKTEIINSECEDQNDKSFIAVNLVTDEISVLTDECDNIKKEQEAIEMSGIVYSNTDLCTKAHDAHSNANLDLNSASLKTNFPQQCESVNFPHDIKLEPNAFDSGAETGESNAKWSAEDCTSSDITQAVQLQKTESVDIKEVESPSILSTSWALADCISTKPAFPETSATEKTKSCTEAVNFRGVLKRIKYSCKICNQLFDTKTLFDIHFCNSSVDVDVFLCPGCEKNFGDIEELKEHVKSCWKGMMSCIICSNTVYGKLALVTHLQAHKKESQAQLKSREKACLVCGLFDEKWNLVEHWREHTGVNLLRCIVCKKIMDQGSLLPHLHSHRYSEPYITDIYWCQSCGMTFLNKAVYENHKNGHSTKRYSHLCEYCGLFFESIVNLEQHVLYHVDSNTVYKCCLCNKVYPFQAHFEIHAKTCSRMNEIRAITSNGYSQSGFRNIWKTYLKTFNTHTLELARYLYKSESFAHIVEPQANQQSEDNGLTLNNLRKEHTGDCGLTLIKLRKEHKGGKTCIIYTCQVCQKSCFGRDSFIKHWREHTGYNPNKCIICHEDFHLAKLLKLHMYNAHASHHYKCSKCSLIFRTSLENECHLLAHSRKCIYFCEICGTGFNGFNYFEYHVFTCHVKGCLIKNGLLAKTSVQSTSNSLRSPAESNQSTLLNVNEGTSAKTSVQSTSNSLRSPAESNQSTLLNVNEGTSQADSYSTEITSSSIHSLQHNMDTNSNLVSTAPNNSTSIILLQKHSPSQQNQFAVNSQSVKAKPKTIGIKRRMLNFHPVENKAATVVVDLQNRDNFQVLTNQQQFPDNSIQSTVPNPPLNKSVANFQNCVNIVSSPASSSAAMKTVPNPPFNKSVVNFQNCVNIVSSPASSSAAMKTVPNPPLNKSVANFQNCVNIVSSPASSSAAMKTVVTLPDATSLPIMVNPTFSASISNTPVLLPKASVLTTEQEVAAKTGIMYQNKQLMAETQMANHVVIIPNFYLCSICSAASHDLSAMMKHAKSHNV